MGDNDKIRPIYNELRGYLAESPPIGEYGTNTTNDTTLWEQLNRTIDELGSTSGLDYSKFKVTNVIYSDNGRQDNYIKVSEYRSKLAGLITRLYGTYFTGEPAPFPGMPGTYITVSNQQSQQQSVVVELNRLIDHKLLTIESNTPESNFLNELKQGISTVSGFANLMMLLSQLGEKYGLSLLDISKLLSG